MDGMGGRDEDLSPAEAARVRRRERERKAKAHELMRPGQAKTFKQILDSQARRAAETPRPRTPAGRRPATGSAPGEARSTGQPDPDDDAGDSGPGR